MECHQKADSGGASQDTSILVLSCGYTRQYYTRNSACDPRRGVGSIEDIDDILFRSRVVPFHKGSSLARFTLNEM